MVLFIPFSVYGSILLIFFRKSQAFIRQITFKLVMPIIKRVDHKICDFKKPLAKEKKEYFQTKLSHEGHETELKGQNGKISPGLVS